MITDLRSHPNPAATKAAFDKMEEAAERDHQKRMMEELFPAKVSRPAPSPSPDELVGRFQSSNHISGLETPGFIGPKRMLDMSGFMESVV